MRALFSADALPDEEADNCACGGDHNLADDVVGGEPEQLGDEAADEGADDTDDQVGQEFLLPPHIKGGDGTGDQPDDEKDDEVEDHCHITAPCLRRQLEIWCARSAGLSAS